MELGSLDWLGMCASQAWLSEACSILEGLERRCEKTAPMQESKTHSNSTLIFFFFRCHIKPGEGDVIN